jgi:hypothetical protein
MTRNLLLTGGTSGNGELDRHCLNSVVGSGDG